MQHYRLLINKGVNQAVHNDLHGQCECETQAQQDEQILCHTQRTDDDQTLTPSCCVWLSDLSTAWVTLSFGHTVDTGRTFVSTNAARGNMSALDNETLSLAFLHTQWSEKILVIQLHYTGWSYVTSLSVHVCLHDYLLAKQYYCFKAKLATCKTVSLKLGPTVQKSK